VHLEALALFVLLTGEGEGAGGTEAASAWTSQGAVGLESRVFRDDGDPATQDHGVGMLGRLELRHRHGPFEEKARGFGRLDGFDRERSTLIAEEAWVQVRGERARFRVGLDLVNWSATEAFHPADVINARNLDSDIESFEKVGEPMAALALRALESTTVTLMFMPVYTRTRFPSPRSRLSFAPPGVDLRGKPLRIDRQGALTSSELGPQAAIQIRQVVGSADIAVHAVEHMDRLQPIVLLDPTTLAPRLLYQTVRQVGGTYQQALGPVVAKLEGAYRRFVSARPEVADQTGPLPGRSHGVVAAGLEYGITHLNGASSTLLLEGQAVLGVDQQTRLALDPFQRDVLVGWRFARNDEAGREVLVFAVADLERPGEYLLNAGYTQRLGETWTIAAGLRLFQAKDAAPLDARGLQLIRNGDHLRVALIRHF
jgi:hypothetical protein